MSQSDIANLNKVGYNGFFEGSANSSAVWDFEEGQFSIADLSIGLKDVGKLSLTFNLYGVTQAWATQIMKLSEQIQDGSTSVQAAQLALFGLMQQLEVRGIVLRLEDDSLTNKILDYAAESAGSSKEKIIENAVQLTGAMSAMMLGKADFVEVLTREVGIFLKNPKSVEISSWPPQPVSFATISATAMTDPRDLIGVLYVDMKAK